MQRIITSSIDPAAGPVLRHSGAPQDDGLADGILDIQHAMGAHSLPAPRGRTGRRLSQVEDNGGRADQTLSRDVPNRWYGRPSFSSTHAGAKGGLGALSMVREARDLLEQAEKIDPDTLNGSIYTTLGSLYYQVPGWPSGYGDDKKAEIFLKKALAINPSGIDPNYFYGDFLYRKGQLPRSAVIPRKGHARPPPGPTGRWPTRAVREEILAIIAKIQDKT